MADLGEKIDAIEGLADKQLGLFGLRFTATQLGAGFALISTVIGALYGGFLMYQKVEEVAGLDIGAFEQQMNLMNQRIDDQKQLIESLSKNLSTTTTNFWTLQSRVETKISSYDNKLDKFEAKVDQTKKDLEDKIQKALDNPLNN